MIFVFLIVFWHYFQCSNWESRIRFLLLPIGQVVVNEDCWLTWFNKSNIQPGEENFEQKSEKFGHLQTKVLIFNTKIKSVLFMAPDVGEQPRKNIEKCADHDQIQRCVAMHKNQLNVEDKLFKRHWRWINYTRHKPNNFGQALTRNSQEKRKRGQLQNSCWQNSEEDIKRMEPAGEQGGHGTRMDTHQWLMLQGM